MMDEQRDPVSDVEFPAEEDSAEEAPAPFPEISTFDPNDGREFDMGKDAEDRPLPGVGAVGRRVPRHVRSAVSSTDIEEIELRFTYHPPVSEQVPIYHEMRRKQRDLAVWIVLNVPKGREQSRALTALEDVGYNANAGIARRWPK